MKMRIAMIIVLLCFASVNAIAQSDDFYDLVLDSFSRNSAFLVVNVKSDSFKGKIIVQNLRLYEYFLTRFRLNKIEYKRRLYKTVAYRSTLNLTNADLKSMAFEKVKQVNEVELYASKGKLKFLEHYFPNDTEKHLNPEIRGAVIARLFEWKTAVIQEDESGFLMIAKTK